MTKYISENSAPDSRKVMEIDEFGVTISWEYLDAVWDEEEEHTQWKAYPDIQSTFVSWSDWHAVARLDPGKQSTE